jgi:DNA-binding NarL/FixJ family response regulator
VRLVDVESAIEEGRKAAAASQWGDAYRALSSVDIESLDIDDLDRLATAAYLTGRNEESFAAWARAHQRCVAEGSVHRAAHFGAKLGQALGFTGDFARCFGWVERTTQLLDEAEIDCVEQGYLEHGQAMGRLFGAGDMEGARALFARAGKSAARFHDRELATLAGIGEGRMEIYLGDVQRGMTLLDEAAVSLETGELGPVAAGDSYCTLIDATWELADLTRCKSWTTSMTRWCDAQQELVIYRGHCFIHRADVLREQGEWTTALAEATAACNRLAQPPLLGALGAARILEGDVQRLLGDFSGAEAAYNQANDLGAQPQPGLALLRLAQGQTDAANAMMQRVLAESENPIARVRVLPAAVQIGLAAGNVDAAAIATEELRALANEFATPLLRARAARAAGAVALARGDTSAAVAELRQAFRLSTEVGAHVDAAEVRLLLADACTAMGDTDTAAMETRAAQAALTMFATGDAATAPRAADGLTDREIEVLQLLAQGHTNRVIAEQLFISEKTVASHISHIFTKIGVTSRAAATAYAYERGLT